MSIFKPNFEPNEVFNPRGEYNREMYVERPQYQEEFSRALKGSMCILVHGQSGTGKTWLTRRMLEQGKIAYKIVNLASAPTYKSIRVCFKNMMARENWQIRTSRTDKLGANAGAFGIGGSLESTSTYESGIDYFMEFLKFLSVRNITNKSKKYIVFENMEAILDDANLIKELANLITLIDDEEVRRYNINLIIIGATVDIHQYFEKVMNVNTIGNRIHELSDVSTLTNHQAYELISRGFNKLQLEFSDKIIEEKCINEFIRITAGIPQRIHELCLLFSELARNSDKSIHQDEITEGIKKWLKTSLNKNYVYIKCLLEKEDSFKNKVLYCVAQKEQLYFTSADIDDDIRVEFPHYFANKGSKSGSVLKELSECDPPLLKMSGNIFQDYSFNDFKCALCLRTILDKNDEKVFKHDIYDI